MALFSEDISINSVLGKGSSFKGDVRINGFMRIDGDLDGNLEASGNVIVGEAARIRGNINARSITVGGIVRGNITAPEGIHLLSTSAVFGDVETKRLQADENVLLHGHCISLKESGAYEEAAKRWQNASSFAAKTVKVD